MGGILGKENKGITMQMEKDFENARQCQVGCPFQRSVSVEVSCLRSGRFQSPSFADVRIIDKIYNEGTS